MYLVDRHVLKRHYSYVRIGGVAALCYVLGAYSAYQLDSSLERSFDADIINAFDRKYAYTVLNTTGFGSNYLSTRDHTEEVVLKKPY